ncbi:MAG TPA: phosphatase PAP2 family protein [Lacunisphaera sp.]|nr:phosphatase PAP2 family protein [Lacunisphaera sp.]
MSFRAAGWDRLLWPAVLALALALGVFEFTGLDLWLQDRCYNFPQQHWRVDARNALGRLVFYNGPKAVIILVAVAVLVLALAPARWRARLQFARRDLWVALLTLVAVPALAGLGKSTTNVFCPSEIRRYGGEVPYVKLCSPYPENDRPLARGHCFPAGHASGGFALLGLMWLRRTRGWKLGGLALGLGTGWWMGGYQMLKGAHYLSHTVVTMLLAWIIMLAWRRVVRPEPDGSPI